MSVSIKKTGVVTAGSGTNMNLMPNSYIMPLGTNNPATGTWRLAGSNNMTRSRVLIENGMYGFQNSGIQTTPSGGYVDASCYGINSFPMEANTDYILSMWARITEGTEGYAGYSIYASSYVDGSDTKTDRGYRVTPLTKEWQRVWIHFKTNATENRNIYIGITTGETEVTTQMCLIKLEKGSVLTPWIPFLTDDIAVADYSTTTLSGEIVSFNDGAYNVPLKSIITTVEPIQSGSGDPYPAGGGKNKASLSNITKPSWYTGGWSGITLNANNGITQTRSYVNSGCGGFVETLKAGTYTISFTVSDSSTKFTCGIYLYDGQVTTVKSASALTTISGTARYLSFTLDSDGDVAIRPTIQTFPSGVTSVDLNNIQVESGSSMTSYATYSNIRPISGCTASSLTRTGVNLWGGMPFAIAIRDNNSTYYDIDTTNKTVKFSRGIYRNGTYRQTLFDKFKPNTQYTVIFKYTIAGETANNSIVVYYTDGTYNNSLTMTANTTQGTMVFTSAANKTIEAIKTNYYGAGLAELYYEECGLFEGTLIASNFVAYNGNTYTLQFGQELYGAKINWEAGIATVIYRYVQISNVETIGTDKGLNFFRKTISPIGVNTASDGFLICNTFKPASTHIVGAVLITSNGTSFHITPSDQTIDTVEKMNTWLSNNDVYICYELAVSFDIQLTPTVIMQLKNQNNIWCDTGVVDECKYVSHSSQVDANFIETHPLLTQVNNSYINSNNFIEI